MTGRSTIYYSWIGHRTYQVMLGQAGWFSSLGDPSLSASADSRRGSSPSLGVQRLVWECHCKSKTTHANQPSQNMSERGAAQISHRPHLVVASFCFVVSLVFQSSLSRSSSFLSFQTLAFVASPHILSPVLFPRPSLPLAVTRGTSSLDAGLELHSNNHQNVEVKEKLNPKFLCMWSTY